jgi:hypothetical protein
MASWPRRRFLPRSTWASSISSRGPAALAELLEGRGFTGIEARELIYDITKVVLGRKPA